MQVGFIGLGHMGSALVERTLEKGLKISGYNRSPEKTNHLKDKPGFTASYSLEELVDSLPERKIIWMMISVGEPIDKVLFGHDHQKGLADLLSKGDIVIDGANSYYKDDTRRGEKLAEKGIHYLDCGTSGGVEGARSGASLMLGGQKEAFDQAEPLFQALAAKNGYGYFGTSGAGHYVKMVHNGIEYGMMQAIAEGAAILQASEYKPDLTLATQVWSNGSIIKSSLIKWLNEIYRKDGNLESYEATIGSLGTGKWTAQEAMDLGIPAHVITAAVYARYESRPEAAYGKKVVQALREHFGMHSTQERDAK
jgi:6-phosphogluconate dehydrogenase